MRIVLRIVLKALALWVIMCVERAIGLPVIFLLLTTEWATQLDPLLRYIWLGYAALLLAALCTIPVVIGWVLIWGLWAWSAGGRSLLASKTIRLLLGTGLVVIALGWLMPGTVSIGSWLYAAIVMVIFSVVSKRERLSSFSMRKRL